MKRILLIVGIFLGLTVVASTQAQEASYQSAVLPTEYNMPGVTSWSPSPADIAKAEKLIYEYLSSGQGKDAHKAETNIPLILAEYQKYNRQYVAFIDKNGDKNIWAVFFMSGFSKDQMIIIRVMDGGYRYFDIKVNVSQGKCYELKINGDA